MEQDDIAKKIWQNADDYFNKYSPASETCEGGSTETSNMTFGAAYELCRGFTIQARINDSSGLVKYSRVRLMYRLSYPN